MIQHFKFGLPKRTRRNSTLYHSQMELTEGSNYRDVGQNRRSGLYLNFVKDGGQIRARSMMSAYDDSFTQSRGAIFGMEVYGIDGENAGVLVSTATLSWITGLSWSHLSYTPGTPAGTAFQASLVKGVDGAYIYDLLRDGNIAVVTNGEQEPKWWNISPSNSTYSDFTWVTSLFSTARSVEAFDSRLVWFNVDSTTSTFPTRVVWSARGRPTDYAISNGAGFEDLMDMQGIGQRIVRDGDELVLFTDEEIWRARKRDDLYAFDFYRVNSGVGCKHPRTITATPYGVCFLGTDQEVYVLQQDRVMPLGADSTDGESRIRRFIRGFIGFDSVAWGVYNSDEDMWQLHVARHDQSVYPAFAFYYAFDNGSWWPQSFSAPITAGFNFTPTNERSATWDSFALDWDEAQVTWDEVSEIQHTKKLVVVSTSEGTPAALHPSATSELSQTPGHAIESTRITHPQDPFSRIVVDGVWLDYSFIWRSTVTVAQDDVGAFAIALSMVDTGGTGENQTPTSLTTFSANPSSTFHRDGSVWIPLNLEGRNMVVNLNFLSSIRNYAFNRLRFEVRRSSAL